MDHQTLGLVDHQHVIVFVNDVQFHFRGHDVHGLCLGDRILNTVADIQFVIFLAGLAVALDQTVFDELLGSAAAHILSIPGQKGIQPFAGNIGS